ncbi:PrsW family intramembrane metalloprotease [Buchananella felis]|uniref:PrsW family intramembrane metalloprotease n=1 Tax=Buchananella felis TaxID=3231492 RepID=UPI00352914A6
MSNQTNTPYLTGQSTAYVAANAAQPQQARPAQVWQAYQVSPAQWSYQGAPFAGLNKAHRISTKVGALEVILVIISMFGMFASFRAISDGEVGILAPTVLALMPLAVVIAVVRWVDRWEPEPRLLLWLTFLWGAGVATFVSAIVNTMAAEHVYVLTGDVAQGDLVAAVVSAPLIEEASKAFILLMLLWWRRGAIGGPVDGVVYAATTAAGFAFVENIFYFVMFHDELASVFVVRGVFSPFAHILFTAMTGLAIGFAARSASRVAWLWWAPLGYAGAVALHAGWNISASAGATTALWAQLPMLALLLVILAVLQRSELSLVQWHLQPYVRAGLMQSWELAMVTVPAARQNARRWAKRGGRKQALRDFQAGAVQLALARHRAAIGRHAFHAAEEQAHLTQLHQARLALLR